MKPLLVSAQLGDLLLGGLLAVARSDGTVNPEEMQALRAAAAALELSMPPEDDFLFAEEVSAAALAEALVGGYRDGEGSAPEDVGRAFLEAALALALADRELVSDEAACLRAFAAAMGVATGGIEGWHLVGDGGE